MTIETYKKLQLFMEDFIKEVEPESKMLDVKYEIGEADIIKVSIIREYSDDFKEALITNELLSMEYESTIGKGYKFFNFLGHTLITGIREENGMMCVELTIKLYNNFLRILESEIANIVDRIVSAKTVITDKFVEEYVDLVLYDLENYDISVPIKHIPGTNLVVVPPMTVYLSDHIPISVKQYFPLVLATHVTTGYNDTMGDIADVYAITFGEFFWDYMVRNYDFEDIDKLKNEYESNL